MRARRILTMTLATAALAGCGDFLSLDARAPNACVTIDGVHVPGLDELPVNHFLPQDPSVTVRQTLNVPFDSSFLPAGSGHSVRLVSFKLESKGAQTMEFIESAEISAVQGSTKTVVATYTRLTMAPIKAIETAPDPAPDVTPYIVNDVLRLEGALTGTPPAKGFTAAATVCFDVATTISPL